MEVPVEILRRDDVGNLTTDDVKVLLAVVRNRNLLMLRAHRKLPKKSVKRHIRHGKDAFELSTAKLMEQFNVSGNMNDTIPLALTKWTNVELVWLANSHL